MHTNNSALAHFIESFENNRAAGNIPECVQQFAEVFLAVTPDTAQCIRSADFASALPKRKQFFDRLGRQSTELIGFNESWLDQRYALANTRWRFIFRSGDSQPESVEVDSTFLVDAASDPFKIVLYLAHQNIMDILRERGIIADA